MIDFEQLKISNVDLTEKIEGRNEDITKLTGKVRATVEVLTHVKEKLHFLQARPSSDGSLHLFTTHPLPLSLSIPFLFPSSCMLPCASLPQDENTRKKEYLSELDVELSKVKCSPYPLSSPLHSALSLSPCSSHQHRAVTS